MAEQTPLLIELKALRDQGLVRGYRSHWISNLLVLIR